MRDADHNLAHLAAADLRGSARIRNSPAGPIAAARQAGVTVFDEPPLGRMLAGVSAILHHGGLNTAEAAVAAGRPQVTLAAHLEHQLNGRALEALGVGKALAGRTSVHALADAVRLVMAPGGYPERAIAAARNLQSRPYQGFLPRLVDTPRSPGPTAAGGLRASGRSDPRQIFSEPRPELSDAVLWSPIADTPGRPAIAPCPPPPAYLAAASSI